MTKESSVKVLSGKKYPASVTDTLSGQKLLGLDWGVKTSFRHYVSRMVDGVCEVGNGTAPVGGGEFRFPAASSSCGLWSEGMPIAFTGILRFLAHGGILNLTIVDPRIEKSKPGGDLMLSVAVRPEPDAQRLPFAKLVSRTANDPSTELSFEAILTSEGASLFMGNYTAGDELDPVTIRHTHEQVTEKVHSSANPSAFIDRY